ncbi:inactive rhomboid protein 1 [Culicoides brevitarsis]|uniref:inactive rhomboid protein 1 n=1 Tax=Culicoides brevitarsis TaxID=469753 RepID=UPI00307B7D5D
MSSEDGGNTYQKQTQTGSSTRKRHYSSSSSSHHSSQSQSQSQQQQSSHYKENLERNSNDYLSSHDDIHSHHSHPPHQLGTNYNSNASPSRYYSSADTYILGNRLSTVSQEKYDENLTCCLPPPSPAPTSDRFILGMPSPSPSSHYQDRYTLHHRIMSPSSRYRTSIPDRYRDMPPKCPDRLVTPVHYLANSTPMASNDNFAYLTSTVHTPVKRYIPTPPTPEPPESDNMSTCSSVGGYHLPGPGTPHISIQQSANSSQQQQQVPKLLSQQPNNANAYAYRLKCCPNPNEQPGNSISPRATPPIVSSLDPQGDHYATPACIKHMKTPVNGSATLGRMPRQQICSVNMARAPSVEYIGNNGSRVLTPVSFVSEPANCLHCSTLRRTTGIHQTTQTTGPISPTTQPLSLPPQSTNHPQMSSNNEDLCDAKQMIRNTLPPSSSLSFQSIASQQTQKSQQSQQQQSQSQQTNQLAQLQQQVAAQAQQLQAVQQSQQQQQAPLSPLTTQQNQPQMLQASPQQPNTPSPQDQAPIIQQQHGNQRSLVIQHQYRESPSSTMSSMTTLQRAGVQQRQPDRQRLFHKQQIKDYLKREMQRFFGVYTAGEEDELIKWTGRYNRFALRRFGRMKEDNEENVNRQQNRRQNPIDRPDILPEQSNDEQTNSTDDVNARTGTLFYRKASVPKMMWNGLSYVVRSLSTKRVKTPKQYSRSFAPAQIHSANDDSDLCEGLTPIQDDEVFFDILNTSNGRGNQQSQQYMSERVNGWRIKSTEASPSGRPGLRGTRISFRLLDGVLDNSRRPVAHEIKYHRHVILDDRYDHRPFFTYWINTVHVLIMILTLVCYGIGPIGFGVEQKTGQVLVTSLSLQQVTHAEYRNMWIGPRDLDLVHLGAKFAACMRKDHKILQVMAKTRRQERETACCIRNDDSGCVQSSQADCSVRGLWPTSISTWKKWSPGDSGPGGRISGSVCGLDPKYCDAPASIAPYEWPDDITKWPICRKTNSFSQRFRFKDHTAEHMVCEVIGHPCCISIYGDCRITTREYCDFVHGYFHEEASLCSQISCLNDVCGMFPFIITDIPDQFYRLFTSLLLHAGILHVAITVAFQHIFLADLERLIGPLRTAIIYLGSGIAGNLTSALLVPYKTEVGPLSSLAGVTSSLCVMLTFYYWKKLKKPHIALVKLLIVTIALFGLGTLPWQQNFASLIAGSIFGMILTLTIVPFMSITKFNRKSKINLIWTCLILHLTIYTTMLIIFYVFPNLFSSLEFTASEDLNADNNFNIFGGGGTGGATAIARSSNVISSSATSSSVSLSSAIANGGEKVMQAITNNNNHHINGNYNLNNIYNKINYNNYSHYINNNNNMISNNNTNPHNPMSAFFYRKDRY